MNVVCIVGKSKTDKSGLMEGLIKELKSRGIRVGALKYHKHGDFEMDVEGKDTWKYAKAGADTVAISSSVKFAVIQKVKEEMGIDDICNKYFSDNDIVLADGFTLSEKPRIIAADTEEDIEVFRRGFSVVAVVGKAGSRFDDIKGIADKILEFSGRTGN
ncbi:molybdopterin-guanine dinucleotide biosynthesis protein B [groundwater metagenome]